MSAAWDWPEAAGVRRGVLIAGVVGLVLCALGALLDPDQFFHSYLVAFVAFLGLALGSLALWMLHNLTGGHWGLSIRRVLEAATRTLPLLLVLFLPLLLGLPAIYVWAHSEGYRGPPEQVQYLNVPFFLVRAGIYFAIWLGMAYTLGHWSVLHDRTGDPAVARRAQLFSGPGLVLYGATVTFAAVDWIMSLEPQWYSSIFGPLVATTQMLPALALAVALATFLARRPEFDSAAGASVFNDLGNLLLAFVMLGTYMAFSQFLLIWSGNLPEEIVWYVHRSEGGWQVIPSLLALGYFVLPFLLLLSRDVKRNRGRLRLVAFLIAAMSVVYDFWLIAPAFSPKLLSLHWLDLAAVVGVGGVWLAWFFWQLQARPLLPVHDPLLHEELSHA